ncbi:MAG: nucleotidyltransferase family protein [Bacteroidota bacterium]
MRLVTILLAAGESRRMGQAKLFLPVGDSTLLRMAVAAALEGPLVIVTGAYAAETEDHLTEADVHFAFNENWSAGMAGSIATGVRKALNFAPEGFLIALADQPTVGRASLEKLVVAFQEDPTRIVATWYPERLGVPAIFPVGYADQLLDGTGANGARQLIAAAGKAVRVVRFARPPVDLDTPEEYTEFIRNV